MQLLRLSSLAFLSTALAGSAAADVIISNFSAGVGTGTAFGSGSTTQYKAFGFTMGAQDFELDEVVLSMNFAVANPIPIVSIYSDASGVPGSSLFTLDNPAVMSGNLEFTFTAGSPFTLSAGTSYWLHVASVPPTMGPSFTWQGTAPATMPAGVATAIGYHFNGAASTFFNRLEIRGDTGIGTSYCGPAVPNSTGNPGEISLDGSAVVSSNDVTLVATSLPNGAFGYFLASMTQGNVPQPAGSQGVLCLGGSIGRFVAPGQIQNSGMSGSFSLVIDLTQHPTPAGLAPVNAGETWNYTAWYRDQNPNVTSNFTNGASVTYQ